MYKKLDILKQIRYNSGVGFFKKLFSKKIQALEGQRESIDPLSPPRRTSQTTVRKNNFVDYKSQIDQINAMYSGRSDYGASLTRSVIDIRTAFIAGEGISFAGVDKATAKWISEFLEYNKLKGSRLIDAVKLCEKEGKCLFVIKKTGATLEEQKIKCKIVKYSKIEYTVEADGFGDYQKVSWEDSAGVKQSIKPEDFNYIHYDDYEDDVNESSPPVANVIQNIVNYDRSFYDLRENNHLYGRNTPVMKAKDSQSAQRMINWINKTDWKIGQALVTDGDAKYLTPGTDALESLRGEMSLNIKIITSTMGVPVHWAGWTDLMSNRATAETLSELIETMTKEIRLKWTETFTDLIKKAAAKSMVYGGSYKNTDDLEVTLPKISADKIIQLMESFFVLSESGYIAKESFLNMIPGIDLEKNKKLLDKQKKEEAKNKPKVIADFEDAVNGMSDEENQEEDENEDR